MTLKMRKADDDIRVHERAADLRLLHILTVLHRNEHFVGTLEAVGDNHLAAGSIRREAVLVRAVDVLERIFATAHVERVAVRKKRLAAELLHHVGNGARIVGAQEAQVAKLAKMQLDGDELVLEVNLVDARTADEPLQFVELALAPIRAQVGEVNLGRRGFCHAIRPLCRRCSALIIAETPVPERGARHKTSPCNQRSLGLEPCERRGVGRLRLGAPQA